MPLTKNVSRLLEKQTIQSENHTRELKGVLSAVRKINDQFGHGTQEDSYELLNTVLGGIFDEINNADIHVLIFMRGSRKEGVRGSGPPPRENWSLLNLHKYVDGTEKSYKRMLVFQPPPVLVIHIDRYEMTMCKQDYLYELYAVVVHTGAISGGHYYAFVNTTRKHDVKRWEHLIRKSTGDIDTLKREAEIILQEKRNEMKHERTEEIPEVKPNWYYVSDQIVTPVIDTEWGLGYHSRLIPALCLHYTPDEKCMPFCNATKPMVGEEEEDTSFLETGKYANFDP
uniref:ubiquitinyl hydrolase 1 n=1 Tax=Magallana gigas TaxID=29159 RepID=K1PV38_MAGGI